jgi:hypothetical protein
MEVSDGNRRFRMAGVGILLFVLVCWMTLSITAVQWQSTWGDETAYILKSWWYVSGAVKPYTPEDATWYQPMIYYVMGPWQWIFGHGVVSARTLSLVMTGINIGLLASLLQRSGCTVWPVALAIVVFVLNEDSIFYFNSATPYAVFICLQLVTLHLLLQMNKNASIAVTLAFGAVVAMSYLLRINSIAFIVLYLAIVWVRAGRDRWRVYFCSAAILLTTWSLLALLWGRQFVYVTLWLPGLTDWLIHAGVLPELYPHAMRFSHQMLGLISHPTLRDFLAYAFGRDVLGHYYFNHHCVPFAAALFATVVAARRPIPNRGWTALFAASYWALLLFHHLGLQSICGGCIQAYANYFNYLAALAGGLALHGIMLTIRGDLLARRIAMSMVCASIGLAAVQAWSLTGIYSLPSIRNRADSLPAEVRAAGEAMRALLPAGSATEFVGRDSRIPLALGLADIRLPPVTLVLTSSYREMNANVTPVEAAQATQEMRQLTIWTDEIAREWIQQNGDWMIVQRQPVDNVLPWLVWAPDALLVKTGLEKCFEPVAEKAFNDFIPPLSVALYRRVRRGSICLGD